MEEKIVANYLNQLRIKTGLTYEAIAEKSQRSESTVKNLCSAKTQDPRLDTVAPVIYAMGGSVDEMLNPKQDKDELKETSVIALKDGYEYQMSLLKEAYDAQIHDIRAHYEQHHADLKENFERRLADKREIIDSYNGQITTLQKECLSSKIAFWICGLVLVSILVLEVMNPNLGWIRY